MDDNNLNNANSKATLEFNMDDHYSMMDLKRCVKSMDLALALFDILGIVNHSMENEADAEKIRDVFEKYNINLDEIIE